MCLGAAKSPKIAGEVEKPRLSFCAAGHIKTGEKSRSLPKVSSLTLQRDDVPNVGGVTGGYDWVIIPTERREEYMRALEIASVENDITKFCEFIATLLK